MERINDLPGMMASILRQELDSMVRVIYLLSIRNVQERERLIDQALKGDKWTVTTANGKNKKVTDREMVELSNKLQGWSFSVYKFGCSFIHLSNFHDYSASNPFEQIDDEEKYNILSHLRQYHGGPQSDAPKFEELSRYFPKVFEKIAANLDCYISDLEEGKVEPLL
jgi:hypothetical protein